LGLIERYSNNGKERYRWIFHSQRVSLHGGCNHCKYLKLESLDGSREFRVENLKFSSRSTELGYDELRRIHRELRRFYVEKELGKRDKTFC